jgi:anti-sigma B factor antagonist
MTSWASSASKRFSARAVPRGPQLLVLATGELDIDASEELERRIAAAAGGPYDEMVVDLAGVTFVDSAGINALLRQRRRCAAERCRFELRGARGAVLETLRVVGVHPLLTG